MLCLLEAAVDGGVVDVDALVGELGRLQGDAVAGRVEQLVEVPATSANVGAVVMPFAASSA